MDRSTNITSQSALPRTAKTKPKNSGRPDWRSAKRSSFMFLLPWFAALLSASLLAGALAFEHIGGLAPCQMCYWQRHVHKVVLLIAAATLLARYFSKDGTWDKLFIALIALAFAISFAMGFWHMGVEYAWWEGPKSCASLPSQNIITASDIQKVFEIGTKLPACSDAPWHLFGLSMAGYNALISAFASVFSVQVFVRGNHYD